MTEVKGTAVNATLRFLGERFGEDGVRRMTELLAPNHRNILESGVLASAWYPLDLLLGIMRRTQELFGRDVPHLYRDMGRASADYALTTIYRIFFKVGSPHFIVGKAASIFKTYYSSGELRTCVAEKGHAVLELHGLEDRAPELCERIGGWMERTVELSGGTGVRIVHDQCANRGQGFCRFEGWWS